MHAADFDPHKLILECRDIGNKRFGDREYEKAEEAFSLGWAMYEMYGTENSKTPGYGCLMGLSDTLRAQSRDEEADELIRRHRDRGRKIA